MTRIGARRQPIASSHGTFGRHLITASDDCTLLAWDLAGAVGAARAGQKEKNPAPTATDVARSWNDLSSPDAEKAFAAVAGRA